MRCVGINVTKKTLHVAMLEPSWNKVFTNAPAGRRAISDKLRGHATRGVLEATASYWEDVAHLLHELPDVEVVVANPRRTKAFAKALDQRGKSDMLNSEMLTRFGVSMPCNPWSPPDPAARAARLGAPPTSPPPWTHDGGVPSGEALRCARRCTWLPGT